MRPYRTLPTVRLSPKESVDEDDLVAIESALEIRLGDEFLAAFVCTPGSEKELALGYMLSSGIVGSPAEVQDIRYAANRCYVTLQSDATPNPQRGFSQIRRFIGTECSAPEILRELRTADGIPRNDSHIDIEYDGILQAADFLRSLQEGRKKTGALHGALIKQFSTEDYAFVEDLGRHNAADKAIGLAVEKGLDLTQCLMISTGRLTADIVSKCAWTRIPLLISFAVATDAGVKFAEKANLTLIGAFKGKRMRLYHQGAARISRN
ncbi:MAG: formate dehydrogenase accessory sulfurtransferase FdhD [Candidatus Thorarchaeota archaeon]